MSHSKLLGVGGVDLLEVWPSLGQKKNQKESDRAQRHGRKGGLSEACSTWIQPRLIKINFKLPGGPKSQGSITCSRQGPTEMLATPMLSLPRCRSFQSH